MHQRTIHRLLPFSAILLLLAANEPAPLAASPTVDAFLSGASKDCPGCNLHGAKLKRRDLSGADLSGADLSEAILHRAKLERHIY